jgi:hypothetical protein
MKFTMTDIDGENEPILFSNSILGNYCVDSYFGNFVAEISPFIDSFVQSEVVNFSQTDFSRCIEFFF